jgi:hypothetical protein
MARRTLSALFAVAVALSLVAAPVTMADWGEQAEFSVDPVEPSRVDGEIPVLRYENLPADARDAVRRAIESPDGRHVVYGWEDAPDRFFYSDYTAPGNGLYVVVYEGRYYELTTYAAGGFLFVYWLFELPFVAYGLVLGWVASRVYLGDRRPRTAAVLAALGAAFHLLGPEFDFPLFAPMQFVGLGALATVVVAAGLVATRPRPR